MNIGLDFINYLLLECHPLLVKDLLRAPANNRLDVDGLPPFSLGIPGIDEDALRAKHTETRPLEVKINCSWFPAPWTFILVKHDFLPLLYSS